jgi:hypothetical protein
MARLKKQDLQKQSEGVWVLWEDGIALKIGRIGNPLSKKLAEEHAAKNQAIREAKAAALNGPRGASDGLILEEEPYSVLELRLLTEAILLDWRNVDDDNGAPLPYTPQEGAKILADPAYTDLKDFIQTQAVKRENFTEAGNRATEKNLSPLSSQTSASAQKSGAPSNRGDAATTQNDGHEPSAN